MATQAEQKTQALTSDILLPGDHSPHLPRETAMLFTQTELLLHTLQTIYSTLNRPIPQNPRIADLGSGDMRFAPAFFGLSPEGTPTILAIDTNAEQTAQAELRWGALRREQRADITILTTDASDPTQIAQAQGEHFDLVTVLHAPTNTMTDEDRQKAEVDYSFNPHYSQTQKF